VGYEINFNRYFYKYQPPRPLEKIEEEINQLQSEISDLLKQMSVSDVGSYAINPTCAEYGNSHSQFLSFQMPR